MRKIKCNKSLLLPWFSILLVLTLCQLFGQWVSGVLWHFMHVLSTASPTMVSIFSLAPEHHRTEPWLCLLPPNLVSITRGAAQFHYESMAWNDIRRTAADIGKPRYGIPGYRGSARWEKVQTAYYMVPTDLEKCLILTSVLKSAWFFNLPWKLAISLEKCLKITIMGLKNNDPRNLICLCFFMHFAHLILIN